MERLTEFISALWQSLLSVAKVVLQSRRCAGMPKASGEIVILGNGPSLTGTIAESADFLARRPLLAVNFAACTKEFLSLRPSYYVLADPHFFQALDQPNVQRLWQVLATEVDWPLTLLLPTRFSKAVKGIEGLKDSASVAVAYYNTTPVEGFKWLENAIYKAGLGMPRPRNVLIPSIMLALAMGFTTVYLAGADHSWTRTLSVDDNNRVVSVQPHFYKDDERERQRGITNQMNYPLHHMMWNFYVAFKSYFTIERYARHIGARVYNITPGSFIDAFERKKI